MKKIIIVFSLFFVAMASAQNNVTRVLALMDEQEKSWNNGSIPGFMTYYWNNDSLMFIGSKGITYGWIKTLDNYLKSYPDKKSMGVLHFKIDSAKELSPDAIFIIGRWQLIKEKPVGGYFTLLWRKIQGEWRIVADHTS
jgi:ketosteroid isomerase-like protein